MLLNESTLTKMQRTVLNNMETKVNDYNYPKITTTMNDSISINLDRTKIIDLLYVYDKINRNIHTMADNNKILLLAKSINLH
jgi:cell division septal protein FtsQ